MVEGEAGVARAAEVITAGGLVAFPTETVYGLGADATDPAAVARIFAAKGRPADHPLIVHLGDADLVEAWADVVPPEAHLLADAFWPGPLTMLLLAQPEGARRGDRRPSTPSGCGCPTIRSPCGS